MSAPATYPIARHGHAADVIARRAGRDVTRAEFEREAAALARLLPARRHVLNLCTDRYRFMLGFAAALQRRQVSLLPSNLAPQVLADLVADYADVYALTDGAKPDMPCLEFPDLTDAEPAELAEIPADQPALVLFTSGSTGKPKPVPKNWGPLVHSALGEAKRLNQGRLDHAAIIGTVPHQHSYGLESMVLLCLQSGMALDAAWPLYPTDIKAAIERAPRPRMLVTTPVHLRALLAEGDAMPQVDLVLSATAPLPLELARQAEAAFGAPLVEIYGCTEAGQVASRRSAVESAWECLEGVTLHEDASGVFASGPAVPKPELLQDRIELTGDAKFLLGARNADVVDVAGKRASLPQLTHLLTAIPGVQDGVFFVGENAGEGAPVARLAAAVVAPSHTRETLLHALRQVMDPAFLPRPLLFLEALPRNALGKLTREALLTLLREARA